MNLNSTPSMNPPQTSAGRSALSRGRRPSVPATAIIDEVRHVIASTAGRPCPTLDYLSARTGTNQRIVRRALRLLRDAGDLRVKGVHQGFKRMRVRVDGIWAGWTDWTVRGSYEIATTPRVDHIAAVTAAGRF